MANFISFFVDDRVLLFTGAALYFLTPSFIVNAIALLIPKIRNSINLSFIYGAICGVMVGGFIGLSLLVNVSDIEIIPIYIVGVIHSLYILIPFLLAYFLNKIKNRLNRKRQFSYGFWVFFMEILLTFVWIKSLFIINL